MAESVFEYGSLYKASMQRAEMSVSLLSIKNLRNLQGLGQFIQAKYRTSGVTDLKEHKHT